MTQSSLKIEDEAAAAVAASMAQVRDGRGFFVRALRLAGAA